MFRVLGVFAIHVSQDTASTRSISRLYASDTALHAVLRGLILRFGILLCFRFINITLQKALHGWFHVWQLEQITSGGGGNWSTYYSFKSIGSISGVYALSTGSISGVYALNTRSIHGFNTLDSRVFQVFRVFVLRVLVLPGVLCLLCSQYSQFPALSTAYTPSTRVNTVERQYCYTLSARNTKCTRCSRVYSEYAGSICGVLQVLAVQNPGKLGSTGEYPRRYRTPKCCEPVSTGSTEPRNTASTRKYPQYARSKYCGYLRVPLL